MIINLGGKMNEKGNIKSQIAVSFITFIFSLIVAYFGFYLSHSNIDLKYTLSERIIMNVQGESVQQLEIKNLGNAPAEKIVVNLIGEIKTYSITKNVENDSVEEFNMSDGVQIIYPELPPKSSIKIAITSFGREGIKTSISHRKGIAEEALSSTESSDNLLGIIVAAIYFLVLGFYLWSNIKNMLIYIWSRHAIGRYDLEKIFKRSSPPTFIKKDWENIRKLAFHQVLIEITKYSNEIFLPLESKNCFWFLEEKLFADCFFTQDEKKELLKTAQESVELSIYMKCNNIFNLSDFKDLLGINKPKLFEERKWNDLRKFVIDLYNKRIIRNDSMFLINNKIDYSETVKVLSGNLDFLDERERIEFIKKVKESFLEILKQNIWNLYSTNDIKVFCQTPKPSFILQQ